MKKILILLLIVGTSCQKKQQTAAESENFVLKPKDFQAKLASLPDAKLLDVRTLDEVRQEHIKGEINFDFNMPEFDILIQGLDKTKPYFVYCAAGVRSAKAAEKMKALDFKQVYQLDGGIKAWKAEGLPTQTTKAQ